MYTIFQIMCQFTHYTQDIPTVSFIDIHDNTGVINDPLGQLTVQAGSDIRFILKSWDGRT